MRTAEGLAVLGPLGMPQGAAHLTGAIGAVIGVRAIAFARKRNASAPHLSNITFTLPLNPVLNKPLQCLKEQMVETGHSH